MTATQHLPVEAYTSPAWFAREQAELFARSWVFAGMTDDWRAPGDVVPVRAGDRSLIVLRDRDGALRAFHNACRHRGARLVEGPGNVGRALRCFYHGWTYDLDGRLIAVTLGRDQFPDLDTGCLGLRPARLGTWRNHVFVSAADEGEPFEDWLADVPATITTHEPGQTRPHDPERLAEVGAMTFRCRANWKIVTENFIDGYHLPLLHAVSLGDGDFTRQTWAPAGRHITFYRPLKPGMTANDRALPVFDGIPPHYGASYQWLFPNIAFFETATSWSTFHVIPVAPDLSEIVIRVFAEPKALDHTPTPSADPLPDHVIAANGPFGRLFVDDAGGHALESEDVMREDIHACEAVQQGLAAGATIGPLARWEAPLAHFQRQVLDFVPLG
jgi:Rieske 2Fe-2S family protein